MLAKVKTTAAELDAELGQHPEDVAVAKQQQQQGGQDHDADQDSEAEADLPPPPPRTGRPQPPSQEDRERSDASRRTRTAAQLPLGVLLCRYKGDELRDALRIRAEDKASGSTPRLSSSAYERQAGLSMPAPNTTSLMQQQPDIARTKLSNLGFHGEALAEITLADIFAKLVRAFHTTYRSAGSFAVHSAVSLAVPV